MTLSFSTKINGNPTYFVERFWASIRVTQKQYLEYFDACGTHKCPDYEFQNYLPYKTYKLHTIREDKSDRWKPGMDIHPVIFNRSPKRFQFAPTIKCLSTQLISIKWKDLKKVDECSFTGSMSDYIEISVDQRKLEENEMWELIHNDGLSVMDFLAWFSEDFEGKIIHWTQLRY